MTRWPRVAAIVAVAVLAATAFGACGVPTETKARAIAADQDLTQDTTPTTTPGPAADRVMLYFVDNDRLSRVDRPVDQPPDVQLAITQLLSGVTASEKADGLLSSIPPDTSALHVTTAGAVVTIDLSDQFKLTGDTFVKACAQIVFTATSIRGIDRVRFQVDGNPINPPTDAGNLPEVSRDNYRTLAP